MITQTITGVAIARDVVVARTASTRILGLLFDQGFRHSDALLLTPCSFVHTCFMRSSIDILALDSQMRVLDVQCLIPWRFRLFRGATSVLELPSGKAAQVGVAPGDQLALMDASAHHGWTP